MAKDFGTASVLAVRDTFKDPLYVGLYTIFVLAACFHGFNGLWTFCITWGVVLKVAAQQRILRWVCALDDSHCIFRPCCYLGHLLAKLEGVKI